MGATVEFFKKYGKCIPITKTCREPSLAKFPPIVCSDGTFISVQAGENYKCYPRENLDNCEYETVEALRSEELDNEGLLSPFKCEYDKHVYSDIPVEVIDEIISKHGGIDFIEVENYITRANK